MICKLMLRIRIILVISTGIGIVFSISIGNSIGSSNGIGSVSVIICNRIRNRSIIRFCSIIGISTSMSTSFRYSISVTYCS